MTTAEAFEFVPSFLLMMVTVGGVYVLLMRAGVNKIETNTAQTAAISRGWEDERKERAGYAEKYEVALQQLGLMREELGKLRVEVQRIPGLEVQVKDLTAQLKTMRELLSTVQQIRLDAESEKLGLRRQVDELKRQVDKEEKPNVE